MGGNGKATQSAHKRQTANNRKNDFLPKKMGNCLRFSAEELLFRVLDFSFGAVGNKFTKRKKKEVCVKL